LIKSTASRFALLRRYLDLFGVRRHVSVPRSRLRSRRLQAFDWQRLCFFRFQINDANRMIVRVRDVESVAGYAQTAGFVE